MLFVHLVGEAKHDLRRSVSPPDCLGDPARRRHLAALLHLNVGPAGREPSPVLSGWALGHGTGGPWTTNDQRLLAQTLRENRPTGPSNPDWSVTPPVRIRVRPLNGGSRIASGRCQRPGFAHTAVLCVTMHDQLALAQTKKSCLSALRVI